MSLTQPKATNAETTFQQSCAVHYNIEASPSAIWTILTDAANYPKWNSTVMNLEGDIRFGAKLTLRVPLDPKRTFSPRVTKLEENEMAWTRGIAPMFRGVRTSTITPRANGTTDFAMEEVFWGTALPLIKKSLPDFGPAFDTFALDLKHAAEGGMV